MHWLAVSVGQCEKGNMQRFSRENPIDASTFSAWKKRHVTLAKRIEGPFEVVTREGAVTCPDGYLAIDSAGWPYPIAADEFERIYDAANR